MERDLELRINSADVFVYRATRRAMLHCELKLVPRVLFCLTCLSTEGQSGDKVASIRHSEHELININKFNVILIKVMMIMMRTRNYNYDNDSNNYYYCCCCYYYYMIIYILTHLRYILGQHVSVKRLH